MKIYNFFESEMQVANVPKLVGVPNYTNSEIIFTHVDDFMKIFNESDHKLTSSSHVYLYIHRSQLLAMKLDKMNNPFINYHELCQIFDCASIRINFNNVKRYQGNRSKIFNDLQNINDTNVSFAKETSNLSKKYNTVESFPYPDIEIIKIINNSDDEACSFYPIITLQGEKLFDNLKQTREEIVRIYNEQLEVKKFKKYAISDTELII